MTAAISGLHSACKSLPGQLHAIMHNEVPGLEVSISRAYQREGMLTRLRRVCHPLSIQTSALRKLHEIHAILVHTLTWVLLTSRSPLVGAGAWSKEQEKLQTLQEDVRTVKCSLDIIAQGINLTRPVQNPPRCPGGFSHHYTIVKTTR
ncbi:hypothetical protein F4782DRAFT_114329 [Xylaria castorea]|nr:hypothetical protein F4782DRAFT_114329 [Xylaria castorea]